jgi:hypothetical protein
MKLFQFVEFARLAFWLKAMEKVPLAAKKNIFCSSWGM